MKFTKKLRKNGCFEPILILSVLIAAGLLAVVVLRSGFRTTGHYGSHSQNTAYNLKTAISTFYTEYRHYPLGKEKLTIDQDSDSGEELMTTLMGLDPEGKGSLNPRAITFYSGKEAKKKGGGGYRKGVQLLNEGKSAKLWDAWGNLYRVRLDTDGNGRVKVPPNSSADVNVVPCTILIWSAGEDGDFSTWKDNVTSW